MNRKELQIAKLQAIGRCRGSGKRVPAGGDTALGRWKTWHICAERGALKLSCGLFKRYGELDKRGVRLLPMCVHDNAGNHAQQQAHAIESLMHRPHFSPVSNVVPTDLRSNEVGLNTTTVSVAE